MENLQFNKKEITVYSSYPETQKGPAILVLHAWWGLNDFIKQLSDRLAHQGYFVVAPDLYSGKIAHTIPEAEEYVETVDYGEVQSILKKLVDKILDDEHSASDNIAVMGFSLGASFASQLANNLPEKINKTVIFYGTGTTEFSQTKASFLCHFAENDPYEEPQYVKMYLDSLKENGVNVASYVYPGTHHWFFETDKKEYYKEEASILAWKRTLEFLQK